MPIATGLAIGLGVAGAAGSIGSAAIGAHAAGKAADSQVSAANHAADLQHQDAEAALAFQKQQYGDQQKNLAPWLSAGKFGLNTLTQGLQAGGQFSSVPQFQAPTGVDEQNDPGFQFRLSEGMKALQNSAASRGNLLTGGTAKALMQYGQNFGSNEYSNVFNRAMQTYGTKVNAQNELYNRYAGLAGTGQSTATTLGQLGNQASGNITNILSNDAQNQGYQANLAGAARASGYVGGANAWSGGLTGGLGNLSQMLLLSQMGKS